MHNFRLRALHLDAQVRPHLVWLCLIILCLNCQSVFSQHIFRGNVINGSPESIISGASVLNKTSEAVTVTDSIGHFELPAAKGDSIEFSHIGYQTRRIVLENEDNLTISLDEAITTLDEVVVVGYGTSLRKDITGAVATASEADFVPGNLSNSLLQLQGKIAGLSIVKPGGDPNGDLIIRIRGATSIEGQPPLLVIDGVAIDDFHLATTILNPNDIATYDILKDASSAAIYGARGANGVILITTKKGKEGKTLIGYSGFMSIEKQANKFDVLDSAQWRVATAGNPLAQILDKGASTDWQDEIARTAFSHNHTVNSSYGGNLVNLRGSVGYLNQEGIIKGSGKEVVTMRFTADQRTSSDKLQITYGVNASVIHRDFLPDQTSTAQVRQQGARVFYNVPRLLPVDPVYTEDGSYATPSTVPVNPVLLVNEYYSEQRQNFFQASVKGDYEIWTGIKVGALSALSMGTEVYDQFWHERKNLDQPASAMKSSSNKLNYTGNLHFNIKKQISQHSMEVTGVYEYNSFMNDGFAVSAFGFLLPDLLNNNLGNATYVTPGLISSFKNEVKLISFLGRAVYSFDDRYLVTVNFRRDGSSKFGPNHRWGNFPSFALAWNVINEQFLSGKEWLGNLKLRASYGHTGNQENLPPNKFQYLYSSTGSYQTGRVGDVSQSYGIDQEHNPDLKWEVRKSFNAGLDFSLFRNRFFGTVDFFHDNTSDMLFLYNIPQPPFVASQAYANGASGVNKGWEFAGGAAIVKSTNFRWELQGNITFVSSYITELTGQFRGVDLTVDQDYGVTTDKASISKLKVGYPAGVFWLPEYAGVDSLGQQLFYQYEDGQVTGTDLEYGPEDKKYYDPTPNFSWGLTNSISFKNLDFSIFFRGVQGQKIFANTLMDLGTPANLPRQNVTTDALDTGISEFPVPSTYWLKDGSFVRLENITLGYTLQYIPGISRLRLYAVANNLLLISSYKGVDPEINVDGRQRYIDSSYYPKAKGITIGLDVTF